MKIVWPDPEKKTLAPIVEVDVELTMPSASSSIPHGNGRRVGPAYGIHMVDLVEAYAHKHKFDEHGRIEELWERRNTLLSEWKAAKARNLDPVPGAEARIKEWDLEDQWRVEAAVANGYGKFDTHGKPRDPKDVKPSKNGENHFLAAGPCVMGKRVYRTPAPGEKIPTRHQVVLAKAQAKAQAEALGFTPEGLATMQAMAKAMGFGAPASAGVPAGVAAKA